MKKTIFLLLALALTPALSAFELETINAAAIPDISAAIPQPGPAVPQRAAALKATSSFAVYQVNGVNVVVPNIECGNNVLAVLRQGESAETLSAKLRQAFSSSASAKAVPVQPQSKAETELAAQNPGAAIVSLNQFFPANVAALFNREPNFAGPNCFNAAFTAAGMMKPGELRHVGNPEADQLLSMYYKKVSASSLQPGDILVLNGGDHGVFYLGGGLIFHKKSYLKQHIYRIVQLEKAYEAEPNEWTPGIFDGGSVFNNSETIRQKDAWRPTGASYSFGQASAEEQAKAAVISFLTSTTQQNAEGWKLSKEMGYFTERLYENLVSDWSSMARSSNPVLKAYYTQLESIRDQANQSIELELLSSQYAQSNADNILRGAWFPRTATSRDIVGKLLTIYGKDQSALEKTMTAIEKDYDRSPLAHIKNGG